jgi:hypothetical protein
MFLQLTATGGFRRLHNEKLHNLYASPNVISFIKSRTMRWAKHVARMGEMHTLFWVENLKGRCHLLDVAVDGKIILQRMLEK